jgi:hypothetical protein
MAASALRNGKSLPVGVGLVGFIIHRRTDYVRKRQQIISQAP